MGSVTSFYLRFPLFFLQNENCNSSLLERLLPAEHFCQQKMNRHIKEYKFAQLDEQDPLFEEIHCIVNLIQEKMTDSHYSPYLPHFSCISKFYQRYIQSVCQAQGRTRSRLLKGTAVLSPQDVSLIPFVLKQKQDELAYFLINSSQQPFLSSSLLCDTDLEKFYTDWLIDAQMRQNVAMQALILEKLSDFYISERRGKITNYPNDYAIAAQYLNAALALAKHEKDIHFFYEIHLLEKMEALEERAFHAFCQKEIPFSKPIKGIVSKKGELEVIRQLTRKLVDKKLSIHFLLAEMTERLRQLFASIIEECVQLMGLPKTHYAFIGLGSMARHEMCLYSDLEFAILIEENTEENRSYFRNLARFLEIKIINMGETEYPVGKNPKSPTPHGFSLDKGGNVPLGGVWELISTPEQLACYQNLQSLEENAVTSNALTYVCLITGSEGRERSSLCERYQREVEKQLSTYVDGSSFSWDDKEKLHERRALILLKGHLKEFEINLSEQKEKEGVFGIKKELYRVVQSIIDTLALFFNLKKQTTEERIYELVGKGILKRAEGMHLLKAVAAILMFRLRAQLFYEDGKRDYLYHPRLSNQQMINEERLLTLSDDYIQLIEEIYKTLYPLYYAAKRFFEVNAMQTLDSRQEVTSCKMVNTLRDASFYVDLTTLADVFHRSLRPHLAEKVAQRAVALNPNNTKALGLLIEIKIALRKQGEASQYLQELLTVLNKTTFQEEEWIKFFSALNLLGKSFQLTHAYKKMLNPYKQAITILKKIEDSGKEKVEYTLFLIETLLDLGKCYQSLERFEEAEKSYKEAERSVEKLMGQVCSHDGSEGETKDKYYLEAYKKCGNVDQCLGVFYHKRGDLNQALYFLKKAMTSYSHYFDIAKSKVEKNYMSIKLQLFPTSWIGFLGQDIQQDTHQFMERALNKETDKQRLVENETRDIFFYQLQVCFHIAKVKCDLGDEQECIKGVAELKRILKIYQGSSFVEKPKEAVIDCFLALAIGHFKLDEQAEAMKYAQEAFEQAKNEKSFALIYTCLSVFMKLLLDRKDPQPDEAIEWAHKVLAHLEEVNEEQSLCLLLPTLLQLSALHCQFYPTKSHAYLQRSVDLITKYGKENVNESIFKEFSKQIVEQANSISPYLIEINSDLRQLLIRS